MLASAGSLDANEESYSALSKKWGIDCTTAASEGDEQTSIKKDEELIELPTITELKARGENRRFEDDLGWILEGLGSESLTVRRAR